MTRRRTARPATLPRLHLLVPALTLAAVLATPLPLASAATRTVPLRGEVKAMALAGDVLYVARQPAKRTLTVERLVPGQPAVTVLRTPQRQSEVALAASEEALAVGLQREPRRGLDDDDGDDFFGGFGSSQVLVGGPAGPLREVASCRRAFLDPAVAVSEGRVVWAEGSCAEPAPRPRGIGPGAVVTGGASAATPLQRAPLERNTLPSGFAASPQGTFVGIARATFFFVPDGEVRRLEPGRLGDVVAEEQVTSLVPAGVLPGGGLVVTRVAADDFEDHRSDPRRCAVEPFVLRPGSPDRALLRLGACVAAGRSQGPVLVAGDRVTAIVEVSRRRARPTLRVVSVRGDGTDRRILARGGLRAPQDIAASAGRVAWRQPRCAGGEEVVVADDGATAPKPRTIVACRAELLTRSARLRGSRVTVRVRCRIGCAGVVADTTRCGPRRLRRFAFGPGTHRLRVRLPARARRARKVLLQLRVEHGRPATRIVKLRRG